MSTDAVTAARLLSALVETLLPGDAGWPSGAGVGVQSDVAARLVQQRGEDAVETLLAALLPIADALLGADEPARVAAVAAWEARDPDLFGLVRDAAYFAYYENPLVVLAINAHGHQYKLIPHTVGYKLPRFDPSRDVPPHGRGGWIATDAVRPVDVAALNLADERTLDWGRKQ